MRRLAHALVGLFGIAALIIVAYILVVARATGEAGADVD